MARWNNTTQIVLADAATSLNWPATLARNGVYAQIPTQQEQGCLPFSTKGAPNSNRSCWIGRSRIRNLGRLLQKRVRSSRTVVDNALIQSREETPLPDERGEFMYNLKTTYFPHIKGHVPLIFRLEPHDDGFVAVPLASRTTGSQRPTLMGRHPAKNGEVFKIVRANGDYSYQVPYNGKIYNLKQFGNLSDIGLLGLETLRRFLECVEPEIFEKITHDARRWLKHSKRSLDDNQDRVRRWKKREFWGDETPANKREYQEMLKEAEEEVEQLPTRITEYEAFIEWLRGLDRSATTLRFVPPPPQQRKPWKG